MSRSLDELSSRFKPLAQQLLDRLKEEGIDDIVVVYTSRTPEEQRDCIARGVSWTNNSKHLPQPPEGKSEAIDLCPKRLMVEKFWAPHDPLWDKMGRIGKSLGLKWGGEWKKQDKPHFEYKEPKCTQNHGGNATPSPS